MSYHVPVENYHEHLQVRGIGGDHLGVDIGWSLVDRNGNRTGQQRIEDCLALDNGVIVTEGYAGNLFASWINAQPVDEATKQKMRGEIVCWIKLDGSGYIAKYGHLSETYVSKGQRVSKGQKIGKMGNTGRSSGPHLHLQLEDQSKTGSNRYLDFRNYLDKTKMPSQADLEYRDSMIKTLEAQLKDSQEKRTEAENKYNVISSEYTNFKEELTKQFKSYQLMKETEISNLNTKLGEANTKVQELSEKLASGELSEEEYNELIEDVRKERQGYIDKISAEEKENEELKGTLTDLQNELEKQKEVNKKWNMLDEHVREYIEKNPEIVELAKNPHTIKPSDFKKLGGSAWMFIWKRWGKKHYLKEAMQKVGTAMFGGSFGLVSGTFIDTALNVPLPTEWRREAILLWAVGTAVALIGALQGVAHKNKEIEHTLKVLRPGLDIYKAHLEEKAKEKEDAKKVDLLPELQVVAQ